jgi:hypothetical protein
MTKKNCKCKDKKCKETLKVQKANIIKQFNNCVVNQKKLNNQYYLKMKKDNEGIVVFDNVLTNGYFSFDGYLDEKNSQTYFNFGRTGDISDWRWSIEVNLFYGSSPSEGDELMFTTATFTEDYETRVYAFYNIKGFFNYKLKFSDDGSELHYINDVLYAKSYFGVSNQAKALNLLSVSNDKSYSYYNNIILVDNDSKLLDVNMERDYGEYINTLVPNIPNFFLLPWSPNSLNESFITKKC